MADDGGRGHRLHGIPACERLHRGRRVRGRRDRFELLSAGPPHARPRAHAAGGGGVRLLAGRGRGDHVLPAGGSVGAVLGAWALFGGLPFARRAGARESQGADARARGEHGAVGGRAGGPRAPRRGRGAKPDGARAPRRDRAQRQRDGASDERRARGREGRSSSAARAALHVVESAGRDALVELRRIVGVLHRGSDALGGSAAPGLSQLDALVERARAAGLPVEVHVDGRLEALPPGLDLVAYRVVQEALTNAIKHAGVARARVNVTVGAGLLELEVSDDGHDASPAATTTVNPGMGWSGCASGSGCTAVNCTPGGVATGRLRSAGANSARRHRSLAAHRSRRRLSRRRPPVALAGDMRWRWLDPVLAGVLLVALEIGVLAGDHRRGPLALNMLAVAGIALAAVWRRRAPLSFVVIVGALAAVMNAFLTTLDESPLSRPISCWYRRTRSPLGRRSATACSGSHCCWGARRSAS